VSQKPADTIAWNSKFETPVSQTENRVPVIIFYKNAILRSSNANNSHSKAVISVSFSKNLFASQKLILGMTGARFKNRCHVEVGVNCQPPSCHPEPGWLMYFIQFRMAA